MNKVENNCIGCVHSGVCHRVFVEREKRYGKDAIHSGTRRVQTLFATERCDHYITEETIVNFKVWGLK